jgi:hypothetical protein
MCSRACPGARLRPALPITAATWLGFTLAGALLRSVDAAIDLLAALPACPLVGDGLQGLGVIRAGIPTKAQAVRWLTTAHLSRLVLVRPH